MKLAFCKISSEVLRKKESLQPFRERSLELMELSNINMLL